MSFLPDGTRIVRVIRFGAVCFSVSCNGSEDFLRNVTIPFGLFLERGHLFLYELMLLLLLLLLFLFTKMHRLGRCVFAL